LIALDLLRQPADAGGAQGIGILRADTEWVRINFRDWDLYDWHLLSLSGIENAGPAGTTPAAFVG
jgi:hypothetical protein